MADAGLTPIQIIQGSTKYPAEMLRKQDLLGTMERTDRLCGLLADVEAGSADLSAILVYDVSRWGRSI